MGGGPYHGDGRKFSTGTAGVTSRISSYVTLNYAAMVLAQTKVWSDISIGPWMMVGPLGVSRATPQMSVTTYALPTMGAYTTWGEKAINIDIAISGGNPLLPGVAPDINAKASLSLVYRPATTVPENEVLYSGPRISGDLPLPATLSIASSIGGDGFPALELFVDDGWGRQLFLAGNAPPSKQYLLDLFNSGDGWDERLKQFKCLFSSNVVITLDQTNRFSSIRGGYGNSSPKNLQALMLGPERALSQWNQAIVAAIPFPTDLD
jgi:hypothetical protein